MPHDTTHLGFDSKLIHAGAFKDPYGSATVPIYQTSTFAFDSAQTGADRFAGTAEGYIYTRLGNPTIAALERCVAELENGAGGIATSSGMGAVSTVYMAFLGQGAHVVGTASVYGPSRVLLEKHLTRFGVESTWVDTTDLENLKAALRPNTRMVYIESPANPTMQVTDIAAVAALARRIGALTICDNTFASPFNQTPLALGVDLVVHSATKYLGGHHDVTAGVIAGRRDLIRRAVRALRIYGPVLDPFAAWLLVRGLRTLGIRVERHNHNAARLAEFLAGHPRVEKIHYPGLPSHPQHAVAVRQMRGFGGMLSFEVRGGFEAGVRTVEGLRIASLAVSLGGHETLVTHPASTSSVGIPKADRERAGITDGLIRVSVGLEDADDLIEDFDQALRAAA